MLKIIDSLLNLIHFGLTKLSKQTEEQIKAQEYLYKTYLTQKNKAFASNADFFKLFIDNSKSTTIKLFSKNIPLYNVADNSKRKVSLHKLSQNYLIIGEGGSGKSSLLYNAFSKQPYFKHWSLILFFSAQDILNSTKDTFDKILDNVKTILPRKLTVYFDSVDEIGETFKTKKELIVSFINDLFSSCKNPPFIRVSCRKNFADKFHVKKYFFPNEIGIKFTCYEIQDWDSSSLESIVLSLSKKKGFLKRVNTQKKGLMLKSTVREIKSNKGHYFNGDKAYINNPLLLMLFIYLQIFSESSLCHINRFYLFDQFVHSLIDTYTSQQQIDRDKINISNSINSLAKIVFKSYKDGKPLRKKDIEYYELFKWLFKNADLRHIIFIHARFFEYFIAKYYFESLIAFDAKNTSICPNAIREILSTPFNNDHADMITSAIDTQTDNNLLAKTFLCFYGNILKELKEQNKNSKNLLIIKEIIFRLGRFNITDDGILAEISLVLKNLYYSSSESYENVCIKRWCAISSSLLGFEEIEMDYVEKMLFPKEDNMYDLVNRSETLVFYGDISINIKNFVDTDPENCISKALSKRFERISKYNETEYYTLLKAYTNAKDDPLKNYRFRLFDLATIYTMLRFHKISLSPEQMRIISNCRIDFCGIPSKRKEMLKQLKIALKSNPMPISIKFHRL